MCCSAIPFPPPKRQLAVLRSFRMPVGKKAIGKKAQGAKETKVRTKLYAFAAATLKPRASVDHEVKAKNFVKTLTHDAKKYQSQRYQAEKKARAQRYQAEKMTTTSMREANGTAPLEESLKCSIAEWAVLEPRSTAGGMAARPRRRGCVLCRRAACMCRCRARCRGFQQIALDIA